jgi:Cu2+-exporting ATPase/Cu+-exporting ATPase
MDMSSRTLSISGMSCQHCVKRVKEALSALPGVKDVKVDLQGGKAIIESEGVPDEAALRLAVEDAGYEAGAIS